MFESVYPVIMSDKIRQLADFFIKNFGFKEAFACDWYISLKDDAGFELAFIDNEHETIPAKYRAIGKGFILNFEVNDVDAIYDKIKGNGDIHFILDIQNEDFGQRHFIIEAPGDIMVDVIQNIPPNAEYAQYYF